MIDDREQNLPRWAQQLIADLRKRVQSGREPLINELAKLRPQVDKLRTVNGALMELLQCAASGGHINAKTIMDTLAGYGLELVKEE